MANTIKYKGRKCVLKGFHKSGAHFAQSYTKDLIGKEYTIGEYFKWLPKQGCFIGDLLYLDKNPLFAKVFVTWIKEQ